MLDANGRPIPTFNRQKWGATNFRANAQFDWQIQNDMFDRAMTLAEDLGMDNPFVQAMFQNNFDMNPTDYSSIEGLQSALQDRQTQMAAANFAMGYRVAADGAIGSAFDDGVTVGSGIYRGQCGALPHETHVMPNKFGDTLQSKIQWTKQYPQVGPQVGAIVITDENIAAGHVAIVNGFDSQGNMILTEQNYEQDGAGVGVVTNGRTLSPNSQHIQGYGYPPLKPQYQKLVDSQPNAKVQKWIDVAMDEGYEAAIDLIERTGDARTQERNIKAFDDAWRSGGSTSVSIPFFGDVSIPGVSPKSQYEQKQLQEEAAPFKYYADALSSPQDRTKSIKELKRMDPDLSGPDAEFFYDELIRYGLIK
jgi:hypothetical protein